MWSITIDGDLGVFSGTTEGVPESVRVRGNCRTRADVHALVDRLCDSLDIPEELRV